MSGFFYQLGRKLGQSTVPTIRKSKWVWQSVAGSEDDRIRAEQDFGRDLAVELRRQVPRDPEPASTRLLHEIGQRLAQRVKNQLHRFHFEAVLEELPNAMALPGGYIFVSRPLLELCGGEPHELAFILGHEMAHVIRGHAADRLLHQSTLNVAARVTRAGGPLGAWLQSTGLQLLASAYSRDCELDADELGMRLAYAAGYDPNAAIRLLRRLDGLREAEPGLPDYFASHPPPPERIEHLQSLLGPTRR